jgi:peptidylprolyl isomerase
MRKLVLTCALAMLALIGVQGQRGTAPAGAALPVMTITTEKGAIEIQFFRADAPKSVEQILALAARNFYRGQRFHRVERSLVQFGDPQSRDMTMRDYWGRGNSGKPIGVAELNKHQHVRGTVGLAHIGDPKLADSQLYILKTPSPSLNGKFVVVGQVIKGMEVVDKIAVGDVLKNVTVK